MKITRFSLFILLILSFHFVVVGQGKKYLLESNEKFTTDGVIKNKDFAGKPIKSEVGSLNGIKYQFSYETGIAVFAGKKDSDFSSDDWTVICKKDAITDAKSCGITRKGLIVFLTAPDKFAVRVGKNIVSGSSVAIRVDENKAFISERDGFFLNEDANKIIDELKIGKTFVIRYKQFPDEVSKDTTMELVGFNEALTFIKWAITKIR